jgi:hypothetical protein
MAGKGLEERMIEKRSEIREVPIALVDNGWQGDKINRGIAWRLDGFWYV